MLSITLASAYLDIVATPDSNKTVSKYSQIILRDKNALLSGSQVQPSVAYLI